MYVKAIIILCAIIILLVVYLLLSRQTNRRTIPKSDDSLNNLETGFKSTVETNKQLRDNNNKSGQIIADIKGYNADATNGIDEALNILEGAKDRSDIDKDI